MKSNRLQLIGKACLYGVSLSLLSACNNDSSDNPTPQFTLSEMKTAQTTSTGIIKKQRGVLSRTASAKEQVAQLKLSNGAHAIINPPVCRFTATNSSDCQFSIRNISKSDPGLTLNAVVDGQVVASVPLATGKNTLKDAHQTTAQATATSDYTGPTADPVSNTKYY